MLAAFFAQTFSKDFVIVDYYTNTARYAKNCENKAKPKMHCNGKCQMMKKLQQEEKKDQENQERKSENKNEITLYSDSNPSSILSEIFVVTKLNYLPFSTNKSVDRSFDFFHPPQVA